MFMERLARALPYAVLLAVSVYLYVVAGEIKYFAPAGRIGPDVWPKMILGLLIATCVYGLIRALVRKKAKAEPGEVAVPIDSPAGPESDGAPPLEDVRYPLLLLLGVIATLAYVAVIGTAGFFLATSVYLAVFMLIGRYRNYLVIGATSILGSLVMMFFFMRVVYVSLPIGKEPFSAVTLFLMKLMGIK